ncbi:MAG: hypothetical protein V1743_02330 [Nanoarchaeota archaeon]
MEFRKLIKFGTNSYVISLPKSWIVSNKLEKGNTIYLENNANQLLLSPEKITNVPEEKEITLDCRQDKLETIKRKIIAQYINNCKIINIHFTSNEMAQHIREIIQNLMALEIIEQSNDFIVAKDYLNMENVSIPSLIRKNDTIIRSMLRDTNETLKQNSFFRNVELCDNINSRDQDVNRISFLIMRTVKYLVSNPEMRRDGSGFEYFNYYELTQLLEKIGDELKRTMRLLAAMDLKKANELKELFDDIEKMYLDSMKAYYNKDVEMAYAVATEKNPILEKHIDFLEKHNGQPAIQLFEKLKLIIVTIHQINRLTYQ